MHLIFNTLFFAKGRNDEELQYANVGMRLQQGRDVQPKAKMGAYGQIGFPDQNDQLTAGCSRAQGAEQVEYGQINFAERPQQKNRQKGPNEDPQESEQVEYGQIRFVERPQQKRKQMGQDGGPKGGAQVEYGQIKFKWTASARWMQRLVLFIILLVWADGQAFNSIVIVCTDFPHLHLCLFLFSYK